MYSIYGVLGLSHQCESLKLHVPQSQKSVYLEIGILGLPKKCQFAFIDIPNDITEFH